LATVAGEIWFSVNPLIGLHSGDSIAALDDCDQIVPFSYSKYLTNQGEGFGPRNKRLQLLSSVTQCLILPFFALTNGMSPFRPKLETRSGSYSEKRTPDLLGCIAACKNW